MLLLFASKIFCECQDICFYSLGIFQIVDIIYSSVYLYIYMDFE